MESKSFTLYPYKETSFNNERIASFLHTHLDRFRDEKDAILKCLAYVKDVKRGGEILLAVDGDLIIGAVVLNKTGMSGYIPENILVYIAVDNRYRGMGIGKKLMQEAIATTEGGIALHCEPDNPALHLYEKLGFKNKYLEMRLEKPV